MRGALIGIVTLLFLNQNIYAQVSCAGAGCALMGAIGAATAIGNMNSPPPKRDEKVSKDLVAIDCHITQSGSEMRFPCGNPQIYFGKDKLRWEDGAKIPAYNSDKSTTATVYISKCSKPQVLSNVRLGHRYDVVFKLPCDDKD